MPSNKPDIPELTDEQRLIIVLCKINLDSDDLHFIGSKPTDSYDWPYILDFSQKHGIGSLVYSNILHYLDSNAPAVIVDSFKSISLENSKKNLFLTSVLINMADELKQLGIEAVPYKGAILSQLIYENITIREFSDLDFIIFKKDISILKEYLLRSGFNTQFDLTEDQQDYYLNSKYYYINFTRSDSKVALDFHWAFAAPNYSFSRPLDYYYERLDEVEVNSKVFKTLRCEDLLIQLCVHGSKHNWSRFAWITDVANLLAVKPDMDYDYIVSETEKLNCINILAFSMSLVSNLFNLENPLKSSIDPKYNNKFSEQEKLLIITIFELGNDKIGNSLFPQLFNSNKDKLNFYVNNYIYPTPIEFSLIKLNKRLFFLYYFLRMGRIIVRGITRLFKV